MWTSHQSVCTIIVRNSWDRHCVVFVFSWHVVVHSPWQRPQAETCRSISKFVLFTAHVAVVFLQHANCSTHSLQVLQLYFAMCNMNMGLNLSISPQCFHYHYLPKAELLSAIVSLIPSHPSLCVPALVCLCERVLWPDPFWALVYRPLQCGKYLPSLPLKQSHSFYLISPFSLSVSPPCFTELMLRVPSHFLLICLSVTLYFVLLSLFYLHARDVCMHACVCECVFPYVFMTAVCTFRSECRRLQAPHF